MKCRSVTLALFVAAAAASSHAVAQPLFAELLVDGSFESNDPNNGGSGSSTINDSGAWTLVQNQPDQTGGDAGNAETGRFQDAPFADNNGDGGQIGIWFRSFEGNQDPGDIPADAEFSQQVAAGPGQYQLSFWEQHEENFTAATAEVAMDFIDSGNSVIGSAVFDIFTTPPTRLNNITPSPPPFIQNVLEGTAPAGTTSILVRATMDDGVNFVETDPGQNFQGLTLDDFSLVRVPEPSSIVMVVVALGSCLALARRRP